MALDCVLDKLQIGAKCICDGLCYLFHNHLITIIVATALIFGIKCYMSYQKKNRREKWNSAGKDVVILHGFPRSYVSPNLSPFVLKLETYLRMTNIKYEYDEIEYVGPKGKTPWITFNGQSYADSELIMEMLNKKLSKDLNNHLTKEEKAISRFINIMLNEHMFWAIEQWLVTDPKQSLLSLMKIPLYASIFFPLLKKQLKKKIKSQGLGVHSQSEIVEIFRKNFEALSIYLGNKPYMLGNKPSEIDCSAFGFLAQFLLAQPGSPFQVMVEKTYPNLGQYVMKMKATFYKDWDKLLVK